MTARGFEFDHGPPCVIGGNFSRNMEHVKDQTSVSGVSLCQYSDGSLFIFICKLNWTPLLYRTKISNAPIK